MLLLVLDISDSEELNKARQIIYENAIGKVEGVDAFDIGNVIVRIIENKIIFPVLHANRVYDKLSDVILDNCPSAKPYSVPVTDIEFFDGNWKLTVLNTKDSNKHVTIGNYSTYEEAICAEREYVINALKSCTGINVG